MEAQAASQRIVAAEECSGLTSSRLQPGFLLATPERSEAPVWSGHLCPLLLSLRLTLQPRRSLGLLALQQTLQRLLQLTIEKRISARNQLAGFHPLAAEQ